MKKEATVYLNRKPFFLNKIISFSRDQKEEKKEGFVDFPPSLSVKQQVTKNTVKL